MDSPGAHYNQSAASHARQLMSFHYCLSQPSSPTSTTTPPPPVVVRQPLLPAEAMAASRWSGLGIGFTPMVNAAQLISFDGSSGSSLTLPSTDWSSGSAMSLLPQAAESIGDGPLIGDGFANSKSRSSSSSSSKSSVSSSSQQHRRHGQSGRPLNESSWMLRFQALKEFHATHGHSNVPSRYDHSLSPWVKNQRAIFKRGGMSQERIDRLNSVAFQWSVRGIRE